MPLKRKSTKIEIVKQVEFVKELLLAGQDRKEILREFSKNFNLDDRTCDTRIRVAREELQELKDEQAEAFKKEQQELIRARQENIQKGLKLTVDSITSKLNLTKVETVEIVDPETGERVQKQTTVSALSVTDLKKIWEVLKTEAGEPTTIQQLQGDKNNPLMQNATAEITELMKNNPQEAEQLIKLLDKLT